MEVATPRLEELLASPLFAGVDDDLLDGIRSEAAIADGTFAWPPGAAVRAALLRFLALADREPAVVQHALSTDLFVVLQGQIEVVQARPRQQPYVHRVLGPGDWFGEISAHSHQPALATYRARGDAVVAALEGRLFAKLYAEDETFRGRIDDGCRDQLALHLRATALCRDLDDVALAELQTDARLLTVDDGDVVASAGEPADQVFLVRSGAIAAVVGGPRGERVLAYYKGNATFGEHALVTGDQHWPADYRALMRSVLVALPREAFEQLAPPARLSLNRAANRILGRDDAAGDGSAGSGNRSMLDELFVMVERESVKGGRALVIDRTKCVRCNMCVESCVAVHDDGIPRLSKVGTPVATDEVLVTACYHCETPQCMLSCDYAAIRRDPQGRIRFEYDNCVGCAGCIDGCPYGVIRLVEPLPPAPPPQSFLQSLPLIGRLFGQPAAPAPPPPAVDDAGKPIKARTAGAGGKLSPVGGKTIKCDLCAGLPFEACVYNCPTTAILRREPQSLFGTRTTASRRP